mgnify:CR=1 FL=1
MKKTIAIACVATFAMLTLGALTSCNDSSDELTDSHITKYAVLTMYGNEVESVAVGTSYTDAGCSAVLGGEDYTDHINIVGLDEIDVNTIGLYTIVYSAVNTEGFYATKTRTVIVYDPAITADLSGTWTTSEGSYRLYNGNPVAFSGYTVELNPVAGGIYEISDLLGGWYAQRAGYGSNYAMSGYINLTADNTIEVLSGYVPGWGDTYTEAYEGTYDPDRETLDFAVLYTDYNFIFNVVLKK